MNSNGVVPHEMGSQNDDARKSAEVRITSDKLRATSLGRSVNHGVGHRESVHGACFRGFGREFGVQGHLYRTNRVRNESPKCGVIVRQQKFLVHFIKHDCWND